LVYYYSSLQNLGRSNSYLLNAIGRSPPWAHSEKVSSPWTSSYFS
jgi:hypothetical protein